MKRREFLKAMAVGAVALAIPKIPVFAAEQIPTLTGKDYLLNEVGKLGVTHAEILANPFQLSDVVRGLFVPRQQSSRVFRQKYFAIDICPTIYKDKKKMDSVVLHIAETIERIANG